MASLFLKIPRNLTKKVIFPSGPTKVVELGKARTTENYSGFL